MTLIANEFRADFEQVALRPRSNLPTEPPLRSVSSKAPLWVDTALRPLQELSKGVLL